MSWGNEYGADPAPHDHSALDITSGSLAVERGGIGNDISAVVRGDIIWGVGVGAFNLQPGDIGCRAYHDADQSILTSTWTVLALNQERWDTNVIHDLSTNNSRLTCKTAGKYIIVGSAAVDSFVNVIWYLRITLNGSGTQLVRCNSNMKYHNMAISVLYNLAINDYVELWIFQDSGASKNARAIPNFSVEFAMQLIART